MKRSVYGGETSASRLCLSSERSRSGRSPTQTHASTASSASCRRWPRTCGCGAWPPAGPAMPTLCSGQGRSTLDAGCLPVVAPAGVQSGDAGRRSGPRSPIRLAPQLRFAPPSRGTQRHLRGAPARSRRTPDVDRYGHVIDELEEQPRITAESAIADARLAVHVGASAVVQDLGPEKPQPTPGRAAGQGDHRSAARQRPICEACRRTHQTTVKSISSCPSRSCCAALVPYLPMMRC